MQILQKAFLYTVIMLMIFPAVGFLIDFVLSGILSFLLGIIDRRGRAFVFFENRVTFVGVIYHELSHALFAFLSGAKIRKISLYHKEGNRLGYVKYTPRGIWLFRGLQMSLASCAPVVTGSFAMYWGYRLLTEASLSGWKLFLWGYLMISVLVHMDMSSEDLKVYLKGVPACFLLLMTGLILFFYFH